MGTQSNLALAAILAFSICANAIGAEPGQSSGVDACATLVPIALASRISTELAGYRLPVADDAGARIKDVAAQGDWPCPFVVIGDFDGNGWLDRALLLPAITGSSERLVAALNTAGQWKLSLSEDWPLALTTTELRPTESGLYQRSDAIAQPAAKFDQLASLQSEFAGFRAGKPGADYGVYALVNGHWQKLAMVDAIRVDATR